MGFGHRVYKNYDPRAQVLRKACNEVLDELGYKHEPLLDLAKELERIALEDDYFVEKKLYPNVDFYGAVVLDALGTILRDVGRYAFDVDERLATDIAHTFERWSQHVTTGARHPEDDPAGPPRTGRGRAGGAQARYDG